MKDIKELTSEIFACDRGDLKDDVMITDLENWDSLKHMEYILSLENEYKISLSGDELASIKKLITAADVIKAQLKDANESKKC